jgi:FtsP/CotA-like multicopper oxidase with cupredoxin domain
VIVSDSRPSAGSGRGRSSRATSVLLLLLSVSAYAQRAHPGRGATSAQDLAKLTAPAAAGSDAADSVCPRFAAGSAVAAPPELRSANGVLEVTFHFQTVTDAQGLARYCYLTDSGLQAPTLRVNPGDLLTIHFHNDLPAAAASASASADGMAGMKMSLSPAASSASGACDGAMSASATNIHFHGTNAAPVCGQDEVVRTLVAPGESFDYNVQVPANEPPGLYWYHPHPHGFSEGQVQGGATGALIVEGLQNVDPALAGLPERTFVIRDQLLPSSELNDSGIPAWDLSVNYVPVTYPAYAPAVIPADPGRQELWRVANTAADTILDLQYIVNGSPQTLQVAAIDGYPIAAGSSGQPFAAETDILLPPGARAEFVVTTPSLGDSAQLVTSYWNTGPDGDFDPTRTLANVVSQAGVEESAKAPVDRLPLAKAGAKGPPAKVTRFAALAAANPAAQRNLYFSEVLQNPSNPNSPTSFFITEQGQTPAVFAMGQPPNIVVHSGTVEDWVVENRAGEDHIFHIHQIHFQVLEVDGQPVDDPAVRDTVDIPYWDGTSAYHSVKLRMDFRDPNIVGTFVYHCHILQHEDAGMMGEIEVLPSGAASTTTAEASASSVTPNGTITLTANVADAATGAATPTGFVQFEFNGLNVGAPVALVNGQATATTTILGAPGRGSLTAFYQGDATYAESVSAALPMTMANFALSSPGATAALGAAAIAPVTVNVATGYAAPIALACALPASLAEAACFVDPNSIAGTGQVKLTVNTTPPHPLSGINRVGGRPWFAFGGGVSLAGLLLLAVPRGRGRANVGAPFKPGVGLSGRNQLRGSPTRTRELPNRSDLWTLLASIALACAAIGCGSSPKIDPGSAKGSYIVVVTATAGSGSLQYQASVNVPLTIQ